MKKSKKLLSLLLAALMAVSSLTVGFYAIAADATSDAAATAEQNTDPAMAALESEIDAFYDAGYASALFSESNADYEAANKAFDSIMANLKALTEEQKLELKISYYMFVLYYATEKVGRENSSLTKDNAKIYGLKKGEDGGYDKLVELVGAFPKDYDAAIDTMASVFTTVDGKMFNTSFDFQKSANGYAHYEKSVEAIKKLSPAAVAFAQYLYVSGTGQYVYCSSPTSSATYLFNNLATIAKNYYQDKDSKNNPSSVNFSTFASGSGANRVWKSGQSAVTYKEAMEKYYNALLADAIPYSRQSYNALVDIFSAIYGSSVKTAADTVYDVVLKWQTVKSATAEELNAEIEKAEKAVAAVTDADSAAFLNSIMSNSSCALVVNITYALNAEDYNEKLSAPEAYSNQIKISQKNANTVISEMKDYLEEIEQNALLNDFYDYMSNLDVTNPTDSKVQEAMDVYLTLNSDFQKKVSADVKAKLIKFVTDNFINYMNKVDMNNITKDVQETSLYKYRLMGDFKSEISDDLYNKLLEIQYPILDKDNLSSQISAFVPTQIVRPDSDVAYTTGGIQSAVDSFWNIVQNLVLPMVASDLDLSKGLEPILEDNLYTDSIIEAIFDLYATLSHSDLDLGVMGFTLGSVINIIMKPSGIAKQLSEDKFAKAAALIGAAADLDEVAAIDFSAADFGFKNGDRQGFIDALLASLRPITTFLEPNKSVAGLINIDIKMFDYYSDGTYVQGVYSNLLPLLEELGMSDLPTAEEYEANYYAVKEEKGQNAADDEFLRPILDHLFTDVVDLLSPNIIDGLIKVLPRLAQVVLNLQSTLQNVFPQMDILSGLGDSLDLSADAINNMLTGSPIDLSGLVGSKCSLQLKAIDWERFANACTVSAAESSALDHAYYLLRTGTTDLVFTELFYYIYDVAFADADNYAAIKQIINSKLDNTIAGIVVMVTDQLHYAGAVEAYRMFLNLFGAEYGDEILRVTLSRPEINYAGSVQRPLVTVADKYGNQLTYKRDFKVDFSNWNSTDVGTYAVKVTFLGNYVDEDPQIFTYKIVPQKGVTPELNRIAITRTGTVQRPLVTVKTYGGRSLTYKKDFTVDYSDWNSTEVGRYTVTVTMIGNYAGSYTYAYYINPRPTSLLSSTKGLKGVSKGFEVKWNKQNQYTTGYQIMYATKSDFSNAKWTWVANPEATGVTIKGRAINTKYYVKIRTYKTINSNNFFSDWGAVRTVKTTK